MIKRFAFILLLTITSMSLLFTFLRSEKERARLYGEMDLRALLLAENLSENVQTNLSPPNQWKLNRVVRRFNQNDKMRGLIIYGADKKSLAVSSGFANFAAYPPAAVKNAYASFSPQKEIFNTNGQTFHFFAIPLIENGSAAGVFLIVHDTTFIRKAVWHVWRDNFFSFLALAALILGVVLLATYRSIIGPLRRTAEWVKRLRLGPNPLLEESPPQDVFTPITQEVSILAKNLFEARAAAEQEAKLRLASDAIWTPERLKEHVKNILKGRTLFVVSNREPYIHVKEGKEIHTIVPASGLVSALEPILTACGGVWIAHGSGDADRESVDLSDRVRVPPEAPVYLLRRVWMTQEEEKGYYYGFSNEGLWPLCHIVHTRPLFRPDDWSAYQAINERFAKAVLEELKGTEDPCVLIQDYHFALLPRFIKNARPDARVALFWHIPWPNPESFGICPWQRQILEGMLGADLLGFHIQYHCNNFLETVDRALESRIDWAQFSVTRGRHRTLVKPFPISVAPETSELTTQKKEITSTRKNLIFKNLGIRAEYLGVGVDRIDYTKGILERFQAIERFLEKYPHYVGRFTFVELGAPSRTLIASYHQLDTQIEQEADRINWKFKSRDWRPILLLKKHHTHEEIKRYYQAADICMVTSLHDGMNLVAKEFVASRDIPSGGLILSRFTGAAQAFRDAIIVNPYDTDQTANAIAAALEMDEADQARRMQHMQEHIRENNIYRWGADLLTELMQLRLETRPRTTVPS